MHEDRDLRRRRQSSPSHKLHESQFKQMSTSPRTCAHTCQPLHPPQKGPQRGLCPARAPVRPRLPSCAQNFLPNLTQSLAISRLSLVYLYVPLTFQRIGQRGDFYRLPAARIRLRFARCPCTQTAICAAAVNHPHHINHVNHSSDKCQRALAHALTPVSTPPSAAKGPPARPALARRDHARGPCATALRSVDISKNWTKSRLLQVPAGRIRLQIRPVPMRSAPPPLIPIT